MRTDLNRGSGPHRRRGGGNPAGRYCAREFAVLALTFVLVARLAVRLVWRKSRRR